MRFWVDSEFNDYLGNLISLALVSENGDEWYEVLNCPHPSPWVEANVIPKLGKFPILRDDMQRSLECFLARYDAVHIIADWPEDIQHFCALLITGTGNRIDTPPLLMEVRRDLANTSETSAIPHNALEDARALRKSALASLVRNSGTVDAIARTK